MAIIQTSTDLYLLLGEQAVDAYNEGGVEFLIQEIKKESIDYQCLTITNGMSIHKVLGTLEGYFGWCFIPTQDNKILDAFTKKQLKKKSFITF